MANATAEAQLKGKVVLLLQVYTASPAVRQFIAPMSAVATALHDLESSLKIGGFNCFAESRKAMARWLLSHIPSFTQSHSDGAAKKSLVTCAPR